MRPAGRRFRCQGSAVLGASVPRASLRRERTGFVILHNGESEFRGKFVSPRGGIGGIFRDRYSWWCWTVGQGTGHGVRHRISTEAGMPPLTGGRPTMAKLWLTSQKST